jgi:hypothetical protein
VRIISDYAIDAHLASAYNFSLRGSAGTGRQA